MVIVNGVPYKNYDEALEAIHNAKKADEEKQRAYEEAEKARKERLAGARAHINHMRINQDGRIYYFVAIEEDKEKRTEMLVSLVEECMGRQYSINRSTLDVKSNYTLETITAARGKILMKHIMENFVGTRGIFRADGIVDGEDVNFVVFNTFAEDAEVEVDYDYDPRKELTEFLRVFCGI